MQGLCLDTSLVAQNLFITSRRGPIPEQLRNDATQVRLKAMLDVRCDLHLEIQFVQEANDILQDRAGIRLFAIVTHGMA